MKHTAETLKYDPDFEIDNSMYKESYLKRPKSKVVGYVNNIKNKEAIPMNKHTAETLKFYLGKEVYLKSDLCSRWTLSSIRITDKYPFPILLTHEKYADIGVNEKSIKNIFPILKTADDLTDKEKEDIYGMLLPKDEDYLNVPIRVNIYFDTHSRPFPLHIFTDLTNKGYGAVPNKESPTGYVDLFENPCVTPKQVEEGVEL